MDGQYVAYSFHRVDPAWRRLPVEERAAHKDAFEVPQHTDKDQPSPEQVASNKQKWGLAS